MIPTSASAAAARELDGTLLPRIVRSAQEQRGPGAVDRGPAPDDLLDAAPRREPALKEEPDPVARNFAHARREVASPAFDPRLRVRYRVNFFEPIGLPHQVGERRVDRDHPV